MPYAKKKEKEVQKKKATASPEINPRIYCSTVALQIEDHHLRRSSALSTAISGDYTAKLPLRCFLHSRRLEARSSLILHITLGTGKPVTRCCFISLSLSLSAFCSHFCNLCNIISSFVMFLGFWSVITSPQLADSPQTSSQTQCCEGVQEIWTFFPVFLLVQS